MKLFNLLTALAALFMLLPKESELYSQNNFPLPGGNVAVGSSFLPASRALHIFGQPGINNWDPTLRIASGDEGVEQAWGHLSMTSPVWPGVYSAFSVPGDLVLQADVTANDLIVTNRNSSGALRFGTTPEGASQDVERLTILESGHVGIGDNKPDYKLSIKTTEPALLIDYTPAGFWTYCNLIQVNGTEQNVHNTKAFAVASTATPGEYDVFSIFGNGDTWVHGKLRVGDEVLDFSSPHYNDFVASIGGKLVAKEIVCTISNWADFVFDEEYALPTLEEVEQHIKEHKHLPEIPSAAEVKNDGLALGEFQAKLLQKVEELTLYLIQQDKVLSQLQRENSQLKSAVERLESN